MNKIHRPLVATALVAAMSAGLVPQALAATATHSANRKQRAREAWTLRPRRAMPRRLRDTSSSGGSTPTTQVTPVYAKASFSGRLSRNTNLKNTMEHRFLQWESQTFGINLGWTDDAPQRPQTGCPAGSSPETTPPIRSATGTRWHSGTAGALPTFATPNEPSASTSSGPARLGTSGSCWGKEGSHREIRRPDLDLQHRDEAAAHLLRPHRGRGHRLAQQRNLGRARSETW